MLMSTNDNTPPDTPSDSSLVKQERVLRVEQDARVQKAQAEAATTSKEPDRPKQPLNPDG